MPISVWDDESAWFQSRSHCANYRTSDGVMVMQNLMHERNGLFSKQTPPVLLCHLDIRPSLTGGEYQNNGMSVSMYLVVILPSLIIKPCLLWLVQNRPLQRFYVIFSKFFDWRSDIHFLPSRLEFSIRQFKTPTSLMHSFLSV